MTGETRREVMGQWCSPGESDCQTLKLPNTSPAGTPGLVGPWGASPEQRLRHRVSSPACLQERAGDLGSP